MPLLGLLWCAAGAINTPSREGDEERTQLGEDQIKQQESHISLKGVHVRRINQKHMHRPGYYNLFKVIIRHLRQSTRQQSRLLSMQEQTQLL